MEQKTVETLLIYLENLQEKHNCDLYSMNTNTSGEVIVATCPEFRVILTTCKDFKDQWCIKLEELYIHPDLRGKGIGTYLINGLKILSSKDKVTVGVWVEDNRWDLVSYYTERGFEIKCKPKDFWLEYKAL